MPPITGMDEIDITEGKHDEEAAAMDEERREEGDEPQAQGEEEDLQEEDEQEEGRDEEEGEGDHEDAMTLDDLDAAVAEAEEDGLGSPALPVETLVIPDEGPAQLPLEKWSEHKLAEAGLELANHLHKLKVYEEAERKHKRHYKENHNRMVDVIEGLRLRIREQRHALGIDEGPAVNEEEE